VHESIGEFVPFIQKLEHSRWQGGYMAAIRRIVQSRITILLGASRIASDSPIFRVQMSLHRFPSIFSVG